MNISIVTSGRLCLPLVHFLKQNRVNVSVFCDEGAMIKDPSAGEMLQQFCTGLQVPLHQAKHADVYNWLAQTKPNATFLLGYGHLVDVKKLDASILKHTYNIHFGALPQYKGANPVFWQLKNGEDKLTVTVHNINNKFDDGPQVWTKSIKREKHFNFGTANDVLSQVTVEGVISILNQIATGQKIKVLSANGKAKYYNKPGLKEVLISWEKMSAQEIVDLIQACNPWNKGAITYYNNQPVKILDAEIINSDVKQNDQQPGVINNTNGKLEVCTADNKTLQINMLNINDNFIPGRDAVFYMFKEKTKFTN